MGDLELPVLAWKEALDRVGGDGRYLSELVGCLLVDLEGHLRELRDAAAEGNGSGVAGVARTIEAKASRVCAEALAEAARTASGSSARGATERIEAEMGRLRRQLSSLEETDH